MSLYDLNLGPGKLVMHDKDRAKEVHAFLLARREQKDGRNFVKIHISAVKQWTLENEVTYETKTLDDRCVIVSADLEHVVRSLVKNRNDHASTRAPNVNYVVNEPGDVLDLDIMLELQEEERREEERRHAAQREIAERKCRE